MKKQISLWMLLVSFLFVQSVYAQSESVVSGIRPEQFKPLVLKVLNDNGYEILNDNTDIETQWKEYTVNLVLKYRAKLSFKFHEGSIMITMMQKQVLQSNGSWGEASIPSKKADDKIIGTLADAIKKILGNPATLAAVMSAAPAAVSSPSAQGKTGVSLSPITSKTVGSATNAPKVPSTNNAKVMQFKPDDDYQFHEGFCALKKHDMWGFIDTKGNSVTEFKYFSAEGIDAPYYSCGIAMVAESKDGMNIPKYLDTKGQELFKNIKILWGTPFMEGIALFGKGTTVYTATYTFYNKMGQPMPGSVVNTSTIGLKNYPFHEGMAPFQDSKTSTWGFINSQSKWAIQPGKYNAVGDFSEGMAPVQNKTNYYWGYINSKGEEVVSFDYKDKPEPFSDGLAAVKNSKNDVGYIDKAGKVVIPFNFNGYNPAGPFRNGYAVAEMNDKGLMIIDKSSNMVRKLNSTKVHVYNNGWIGWFHDLGENATSTWGIMTPDGKDILIPGYFNYIGEFSDGLAWASADIDGKQINGFINENFDFAIIQETE